MALKLAKIVLFFQAIIFQNIWCTLPLLLASDDVFCKVAAIAPLLCSLSLKDIEFQAQLKTPNTLWQTVKKT